MIPPAIHAALLDRVRAVERDPQVLRLLSLGILPFFRGIGGVTGLRADGELVSLEWDQESIRAVPFNDCMRGLSRPRLGGENLASAGGQTLGYPSAINAA